MNILFCSHPFRPSIGGIETVSALLAERFCRQGHEVVLVTQTGSDGVDAEPYRIVRRPGAWTLAALVRRADIVFHNNISLRFAWPLWLWRRPWVIAHHTWLPTRGARARLKRAVLERARHVAVSAAVAQSLHVPCAVIPNPYDDLRFGLRSGIARDGELLFVGRLVGEKGAHVLLDALVELARAGRKIRLTLVGGGPDGSALRERARVAGIADQVIFAGRLEGNELVQAFCRHRVLVVPSIRETFGIVALEAMACGCVPLVTRSGGLPEAVGTAGLVVPPDDAPALAKAIAELLDTPLVLSGLRAKAAAHLARHTRDHVAREYLHLLTAACRDHDHPGAARAV